ncbi:MAG: DoxX family membrane protein [Proteobacteria bacterium]|nr:DoxX family membrane protein [Pseudomonadota bacterium]
MAADTMGQARAASETRGFLAKDWGWLVFGLSVAMLGVTGLAYANFLPGQPAPKWLPARVPLGYAANGFMTAAGLAIAWRRTTAWGALALAIYYGVLVVALMNGRMIARNAQIYMAYSNTAEQAAILAGAAIVWAERALLAPGRAAWVVRAGQVAFGVCAVLFGGAHFAYMNFTAPLVPDWLPPSQLFWGYATGVFHILGGLAIIVGVRARLAAILLTVMYASWTPIVHLPLIILHPTDFGRWIENATNLVLTGAAWVVADSLRPSPSGEGQTA